MKLPTVRTTFWDYSPIQHAGSSVIKTTFSVLILNRAGQTVQTKALSDETTVKTPGFTIQPPGNFFTTAAGKPQLTRIHPKLPPADIDPSNDKEAQVTGLKN